MPITEYTRVRQSHHVPLKPVAGSPAMQSRSTDGDGKDRITTLQQQVDTLEEELKALRQRRAPETTPPPPPPPAPPPPHPQPAIPRSPTPTRSTPLPTAPMEKTIAPPRRPAAQEGGYEMRRGTPPPPPPPHRDDTDDFVVSDPTLLHSPSRPGGMPSEGEHHDVAALKAQIREVHASFAALKEDNMRLAREYRLLLEKKGEGQDVHSDAKYVQLAEAVREVDRKVSAQQEMHGTMVGVMSRFEDLQRKTGQLLKENAELREMLTTRGQELTEALRRVQAAETRAMSAVEAKEKAILALEEAERDHGTRDTQYAAMQERTREAEGRNQALKHKALVMTQQVALWQQRLQSSTCLPRTHRHTFLTDGLEQLAQTAHELFTLITGDSPPPPPPP
eukprot:Sspe_Gene.16949::Locus_5993_Transcript_4_7_Confidence_0.333_Length_2241::g.16949::m.16949